MDLLIIIKIIDKSLSCNKIVNDDAIKTWTADGSADNYCKFDSRP